MSLKITIEIAATDEAPHYTGLEQEILAALSPTSAGSPTAPSPAPKAADPAPAPKTAPAASKPASKPAPKAKKEAPVEEPPAQEEEKTLQEELFEIDGDAAPAAEEPTLQDAIDRATELVSNGKASVVKEALAAQSAKRVSELKGKGIAAFLTAVEGA